MIIEWKNFPIDEEVNACMSWWGHDLHVDGIVRISVLLSGHLELKSRPPHEINGHLTNTCLNSWHLTLYKKTKSYSIKTWKIPLVVKPWQSWYLKEAKFDLILTSKFGSWIQKIKFGLVYITNSWFIWLMHTNNMANHKQIRFNTTLT